MHVVVIIAPSKETFKLDPLNDCSEHNEAPTTINTFGPIGTKNTIHIIDLSCPYVHTIQTKLTTSTERLENNNP